MTVKVVELARLLACVLAVAIAGGGISPALSQGLGETALSREEQGRLLDDAVQILGGNANIIVRWNSNVRFAVVGGSTELEQIAQETIREVGTISGVPISILEHDVQNVSIYLGRIQSTPEFQLDVCAVDDSRVCSNFVVVFTDNQTMLSLAKAIPLRSLYARSLQEAIDSSEPIPCFFSPFQVRNAEILQALVFVDEEQSIDLITTCIHEEFYQSFGLFADVTGSEYFSFDNRVLPKAITDYDRALLKALYDPSIGPGAPVFSVLKILMNDLAFDLYDGQ